MNIVEIDKKEIYGIITRTTNTDEMNPKTAKIGKIWQKFATEVSVDYQNGERVYGVYYNYQSDADSKFNVLAGYEQASSSLEKVTIQKGRYIVFTGQASTADDNGRIQAVIATWTKVWEYFGNNSSKHNRAYKTDFEYYKNQTDIDIYISIV